MTNWLIVIAGILAGATALFHIVAGRKEIAQRLLVSSIDETTKLTLYACWHLVSATLFLSSLALLLCGSGIYRSPELIAFVSVMWLLFSGVFLVINLGVAKPRGIFRFPQWTLLLPVGLLGLWGLA